MPNPTPQDTEIEAIVDFIRSGGCDDIECAANTQHDRCIAEATQKITALLTATEKAYGGCHKCYGKGYSTTWSGGVRGSADFYGDKTFITPAKKNLVFCTCDRGKQLKELLQAQEGTE